MVRRYDETVEVREGAAHGPSLFLWRGRLYVVRQVLGHWRERRAWWLEGATARLLGLDDGFDDGFGGHGLGHGAAPDRAPADEGGDVLEREIWRVEAGAGRSGGTGVYDLGRDVLAAASTASPAPASPAPPARWSLLQVAD